MRFFWLLPVALAGVACGANDETPAGAEDDLSESKMDSLLESLRQRPEERAAFLRKMPKGGDLHTHLSGAVYAESYLAWAKRDGLCVNPVTHSLVWKTECSVPGNVPVPAESTGLYRDLVRAFSMEDFVASESESGLEHFFAAFAKFLPASYLFKGEMLAEVATRAAENGVSYVEPMISLTASAASKIAERVWPPGTPLDAGDFPALRQKLLSDPDWQEKVVKVARGSVTEMEAEKKALLKCETAQAREGCRVEVRYVFQATRTAPPANVFAQLLAGFALARVDERIVGVNLSAAENDPVALRDYDLHMRALGHLVDAATEDGGPRAHVAVHAGELTDSILSDADETHLQFHIRRAVELGRAERIGHGLSIRTEIQSDNLLSMLRSKSVLLEACLSSNDHILGVEGAAHPLPVYLAAKVPVALATDDEGVSRSDLSKEFARAFVDVGLRYRDLKRAARQSLEHAFVSGDSLWASIDQRKPVAACRVPGQPLGSASPSQACKAFVDAHPRARLQLELEERLRAFEAAAP